MNVKLKSRSNRDASMVFRPTPVLRAGIVKWAERQGERLTLSQAVCELVESGLKVKEADPSGRKQERRARKMAGETIDDMISANMTAALKLRASDTCLTGLKSLAAFALTAERQVDLLTAASETEREWRLSAAAQLEFER